MQPEGLEQVKAIFAEAMERTAMDRPAFLDAACGQDGALRAEVEAFVLAAERAGEFLNAPTQDETSRHATNAATGLPTRLLHEVPGTTIGRYKLLQLIGEGGFGSVFMAEQEAPVRRKVALKIIKLGMDTKQVIARFEAERQALAMMDHPNIAKVLDGGSTETGRPYFVMELVKGVPITAFCNENRLSTTARLNVFTAVCGAVLHAHQKGVIHRDIKPSNVLVTMHDDKPVPMVIDFGIAKATQGRLTEKTMFTEFKQMIGTPAYMSPEQAQMSALDVDTRSDIYSLGVLLYELLTGTTPFDAKELLSLAYEEMQRVIREEAPPKPSTRLSTLANKALPALARQQRSEAKQLGRTLQGDLDWIVMKCLEKDRTRRYESVSGLEKDIQRFLAHEPVEASPPSVIYRARRFVRRYRRGLQIVAAVASLLTATTAFSVWEAIRARRAQADALAAEQAARTEAAKSKQVAKFLEDVLVGVTPTVAQGRDTTILREILDRTESRLDRELADQPEVRAEIYSTLGNAYFHFQSSKAVELQRKALALRRALFKGDNSAVADSLYRLADALQTYPESVPLAKECVAMRQRLSGDSEDTANALTLLGMVLRIQKRYSEAETFLRRGLDMETRLKEQDSQQFTGTAGELGEVLWFEGKRAEGLALTRQYLTMIRSVAPASIEYPLRHLTWELQSEGELLEAKAAANELLTLVTKIYPESNPRKIWNMGVLAGICNDLGEYGDAERLGRQRLEDTRKHLTANPTEAASDLDMAEPMTVLAQILTNQQKYAEAESLYRDALDESRRASPPDDEAIAWNQIHWAILLSAERKFDQAEPMLRQGLAYCRKLEPVNQYDVAWSTTSLANALSDQGKYAEADPLFREASQIFRAVTGAGNPGREWNTTCFANSLLREDNYAQSEPLFREALAAERQTHQGQTVQTRLTAQGLADLLTRTDRAAEAAELEKEFGLTSPATKPAAIRPLSTAPTPSPNEFN